MAFLFTYFFIIDFKFGGVFLKKNGRMACMGGGCSPKQLNQYELAIAHDELLGGVSATIGTPGTQQDWQ